MIEKQVAASSLRGTLHTRTDKNKSGQFSGESSEGRERSRGAQFAVRWSATTKPVRLTGEIVQAQESATEEARERESKSLGHQCESRVLVTPGFLFQPAQTGRKALSTMKVYYDSDSELKGLVNDPVSVYGSEF